MTAKTSFIKLVPGNSSVQSAFHYGSTVYEHGHVVKYYIGAELARPLNETEYQFVVESKVKYPKITTRWNASRLLEEDLEMEVDGKVTFGEKKRLKEIEVRGSLQKTDEQRKAIMDTKEYHECMKQQQDQIHLSPGTNTI